MPAMLLHRWFSRAWNWAFPPLLQDANPLPTARSYTMQNTQQLPEAQRQRCEVWTRVMGYHRPVTAFNPGKQSEHFERQHFTEAAARVRAA